MDTKDTELRSWHLKIQALNSLVTENNVEYCAGCHLDEKSCRSEGGGRVRTAALAKLFNGPRILGDEKSHLSEAGGRVMETAALVKLFNSPRSLLQNEKS